MTSQPEQILENNLVATNVCVVYIQFALIFLQKHHFARIF